MSYGLKPTPATQKALSGSSLIDLEHEGVRFVRLTWVDLSNTIRYRIIPLAHYLALCNTEKPGISIVRAAPGFVFNTSALPNGAVGEAIYRPDLESIARLPYAPSHASVMGWFDDKRPGRDDLLEKASELCPRGLLKRVVEYVLSLFPFKWSSANNCNDTLATQQPKRTPSFLSDLRTSSSSSIILKMALSEQ